MTILSQEFVFDAIEQERNGLEFPIDFDNVWEALGYSTKQKALHRLEATHDESVDYTLNLKVKRVEGNRGGGSTRYREIKLSIHDLNVDFLTAGLKSSTGGRCVNELQ